MGGWKSGKGDGKRIKMCYTHYELPRINIIIVYCKHILIKIKKNPLFPSLIPTVYTLVTTLTGDSLKGPSGPKVSVFPLALGTNHIKLDIL